MQDPNYLQTCQDNLVTQITDNKISCWLSAKIVLKINMETADFTVLNNNSLTTLQKCSLLTCWHWCLCFSVCSEGHLSALPPCQTLIAVSATVNTAGKLPTNGTYKSWGLKKEWSNQNTNRYSKNKLKGTDKSKYQQTNQNLFSPNWTSEARSE